MIMLCVNWYNVSVISKNTGTWYPASVPVYWMSLHPQSCLSKCQFSHQHDWDSTSVIGVLSARLTVSGETEGEGRVRI